MNGAQHRDDNVAPSDEVTFDYDGRRVTFRSVDPADHILNDMQRRGTFYECDVLERLRERLELRREAHAAIDAGSFIGGHSIYFAMFCGLRPVLAFEANPNTYPILLENIRLNHVEGIVIPTNEALGAHSGHAHLRSGDATNRGSSQVVFAGIGEAGSVPAEVKVTTIDDALEARAESIRRIALLKIDVEGAELEVLAGAQRTIRAHTPIMCVEVHTMTKLRKVLSALSASRYWIIDCRGYSPTYILEPSHAPAIQRLLVNLLWLVRASTLNLPGRASGIAGRCLGRLAKATASRATMAIHP